MKASRIGLIDPTRGKEWSDQSTIIKGADTPRFHGEVKKAGRINRSSEWWCKTHSTLRPCFGSAAIERTNPPGQQTMDQAGRVGTKLLRTRNMSFNFKLYTILHRKNKKSIQYLVEMIVFLLACSHNWGWVCRDCCRGQCVNCVRR